MKLALTTLCERPDRRTGLTTFFSEFVTRSLAQDEALEWIVFADPRAEFDFPKDRVRIIRWFSGKRLAPRLAADHLLVAPAARLLGASALVTIGFLPLVNTLPTVMHLLFLAPLRNRAGARDWYRQWMMARGLRKADLVITNSAWAKSEIVNFDPGCEERLTVSYEGVQHEHFNSVPPAGERELLRAELDLDPGFLLWVSNFYPYKQPELLLRGYALLDADVRRRAPLVMCGGDWEGSLVNVKRVIRELGIEKDVRFIGWVDDRLLPTLYRSAVGLCLASREETFGRCVTEAMACGTICIVNDIPIMREVTGGHAILVDYSRPSDVASALLAVVTDTSRFARLRAKAIDRARHFSFDRLAAERIAAIRQVLG